METILALEILAKAKAAMKGRHGSHAKCSVGALGVQVVKAKRISQSERRQLVETSQTIVLESRAEKMKTRLLFLQKPPAASLSSGRVETVSQVSGRSGVRAQRQTPLAMA